VNSVVTYDPYLTSTDISGIQALAESAIVTYFDTELEKFDTNMYYSKLLNIIDSSDPSVISNLTTIGLQKRVRVTLNSQVSFDVKFSNKLALNSVRSSNFNILFYNVSTPVYFKDIPNNDGENTGVLNLYNALNNQLVKENSGTVHYATGLVTFVVEVIDANNIENLIYINASPATNDIFTALNSLITYNNTGENTTLGLSQGINVSVVAGQT
jgi:hypothetical protein